MFKEELSSFKQLLSLIPFHAADYLVIILAIFYIAEEVSSGAVAAFSNLISVLTAFFVGLFTYTIFAQFFVKYFAFSKGFADAISFLTITSVFYIFSMRMTSLLFKKVKVVIPATFSKVLAGIFGFLSFSLIASFIISLLLSFPISTLIKSQVKDSVIGQLVTTKTQTIESKTKEVFGGAINESLNFLTVQADPKSTINLNFKTTHVSIDSLSETVMLQKVNEARQKAGVLPLTLDPKLTIVAEDYGKNMFARGYFSHYTPEGISPFDRLEHYSVPYNSAAENLAYAPDTELAMTGLMNSPGHKRNILDPSFKKIGIGVIDAGTYGKIFVQEFTD